MIYVAATTQVVSATVVVERQEEGDKEEEFPEVRDCFMIYGGQVANASARRRK